VKTPRQYDEEAADKWCARAIAAYKQARLTEDPKWLVDAAGYAHEANEHAAGVSKEKLAEVNARLDLAKQAGLAAWTKRRSRKK